LKSSFVIFKVTNYNGCAQNIEKRDTFIFEKREGTITRSNLQLICLKIKTHLMKMEGGKIHSFFGRKKNKNFLLKTLVNLELLCYHFTKCSKEKVRESEREEQWKKNNLLNCSLRKLQLSKNLQFLLMYLKYIRWPGQCSSTCLIHYLVLHDPCYLGGFCICLLNNY
jgi:hypothetical protein